MTVILEAESLGGVGGRRNFAAQDVAGASGGKAIGLKRGRTGQVETTLKGEDVPPGAYKIRVVYFDETDGTSTAQLSLDGTTVGAWAFDGLTGAQVAPGGRVGPGAQAGNKRAITFDQIVQIADGSELSLTATAADGEAARIDRIELIAVYAPTDIALGATTVVQGVAGLDIGRVTVVDPDATGPATLAVDDARFEIVDGTLRLRADQALDAATEPLVTVRVTATDQDGLVREESFDIEVVATAPEISVIALDLAEMPGRLVFNYIERPGGRVAKDTGEVLIRNDGTASLSISDLALDGPFSLIDSGQDGPRVLAAGESLTVGVKFDRALYDPATDPDVFFGALRIHSDDSSEPVATIDLGGFWSPKPEGGNEAAVNEVFAAFGFGNRLPTGPGGRDLPTDYRYEKTVAEEILSPFWRIADGAESFTITRIGAFVTSDYSDFGIHDPGNGWARSQMLGFDKSQHSRFLPETVDGRAGTLSFTAATIPDGWQGTDLFGFVSAGTYSDHTRNWGDGHGFRIFQALDAAGNRIADTYLGTQDGVYGNEDFNDGIYLITGVAPVTPQEGLF